MTTLGHHRAYMQRVHTNNNNLRTAIEKYVKRGWKCQQLEPLDVINPLTPCQPIRSVRSLGDKFTLTIPLRTEGVRAPASTPDSALELTNFNINQERKVMHGPEDATISLYHYHIRTFCLSACILRRRYVCGDAFGAWLGRILDYKALEQLHELPLTLRPHIGILNLSGRIVGGIVMMRCPGFISCGCRLRRIHCLEEGRTEGMRWWFARREAVV